MSDEQASVLVERGIEHIAIVKLNRPAVRNAVNAELAQALGAAVQVVDEDDTLRVGILTATSHEVFCAGADLGELAAGRGASLFTKEGGFAGFVRAPRRKPWIVAVEGKAYGGGLELCLACDLLVAGANASFGLPEPRRGILAGAGGVFRLPRAIPRAIALGMIATGEPIDAQSALRFGLVNEVASVGQALERAIAIAQKIVLCAPLAVQESLAIARAATAEAEEELWQKSRDASSRLLASRDAGEGPRAFMEKRAPRWFGC